MKFGPKFNKLFLAYPDIDKAKITHNRVSKLSRTELYEILKVLKRNGIATPAQPTRTPSHEIRRVIYDVMTKLDS